jgi:hypothetical protein
MSTGQGPGPPQGTGTRVTRDFAPPPVQQGVTSPEPPLPPTAREKLKRLVADHLTRGTYHVKVQQVQELATSNPSLRDTFLAVRAAANATANLLTQIRIFTETCSIDTLVAPGSNNALARALGSHITTVL